MSLLLDARTWARDDVVVESVDTSCAAQFTESMIAITTIYMYGLPSCNEVNFWRSKVGCANELAYIELGANLNVQ